MMDRQEEQLDKVLRQYLLHSGNTQDFKEPDGEPEEPPPEF